jgi:CheY-like chemotaxis protein
MLQLTLKRLKIESDLTSNGSEAISRVKEVGLDYYKIIFMDNMMPVMVIIILIINIIIIKIYNNRMVLMLQRSSVEWVMRISLLV